ncbi:hypothetical protein [Sphingomicrobium lutaoense]|uniref:O-antigen ligase n=1 Tax=Sphingomicrobium lutaoense TaxID=515949 RepID=A0A839YYX7_9SPHN|nr:hypothetical protein [Sphingomicrobium lutaoense]MBB3763518.1 hypothetical protein [Sphingomicrobium lutaoense]
MAELPLPDRPRPHLQPAFVESSRVALADLRKSWHPIVWGLIVYVAVANLLISALTPLRIAGILDPVELRNPLLIASLGLWVVLGNPFRILKPRFLVQYVLILMIVVSAWRGIENFYNPFYQRNYLSHLFQLGSAYCLLGVGYHASNQIPKKVWMILGWATVGAVLLSTQTIISSLERGEVERFYTAAYSLLLPMAFGLLYSRRMAIASFLLLIISNKRAVMLAIAPMFAVFMKIGPSSHARRRKVTEKLLMLLVGVSVMASAAALLGFIAGSAGSDQSGVTRAAQITYERMASSIEVGTGERSLEEIDAGRTFEVQTALDTLDSFELAFGSGAGWTIYLRDHFAQNVHFTPISLTVVFGVFFAVYIYAFLIRTVWRGMRRTSAPTVAESIAPIYLSGAIVHTLFAYSIFIDFFIFFFAGAVLAGVERDKAARSAA